MEELLALSCDEFELREFNERKKNKQLNKLKIITKGAHNIPQSLKKLHRNPLKNKSFEESLFYSFKNSQLKQITSASTQNILHSFTKDNIKKTLQKIGTKNEKLYAENFNYISQITSGNKQRKRKVDKQLQKSQIQIIQQNRKIQAAQQQNLHNFNNFILHRKIYSPQNNQ